MDEKRTAGILVPEWRSSFPSDPPINNNYEVCGGRGSQAWRRLGEDLCKGNEAQPSEWETTERLELNIWRREWHWVSFPFLKCQRTSFLPQLMWDGGANIQVEKHSLTASRTKGKNPIESHSGGLKFWIKILTESLTPEIYMWKAESEQHLSKSRTSIKYHSQGWI